MRRTKKHPRADLIIVGDLHLREDQPACRTDDYWSTQWRKIDFIRDLQRQHGCPVPQPGDFFDHWKPSPRLLAQTFLHLPAGVRAVYGNHDLPQHSMNLVEKSGLFALASAGTLEILDGIHYGQTPSDNARAFLSIKGRKVLVWHTPVYERKPPPWHEGAVAAKDLLDDNSFFDLIITGDVHERFVVRLHERLLVNAGSLMRMTADQADYVPAIYLYYAEDNQVEEVILPYEQDVVSREHLDRARDKESRYQAFIERLREEGRPELSFQANLERHFKSNNTPASVKQVILEAMEKDDGQASTA